ncbi:E3 ubiquitin-protein ligase neur isoform X2 [Tachypleus tridentatus]|uniref:E3 ubiquitin-protein ligase neur isoform X2 n=1 Tax=Tachypleus tridentatus TaxID=6853 RepID=UPI003FD4BCAA
MKVLKKIKRLASSYSRSPSNQRTNNLPPLLFHSVHGENIRVSRDGAVARRTESFCKGIAFSSRPVQVNERVILKFAETSSSWSGALRFGFTANDPSNFRSALPKYACPDLTNKPGNWAKALGERFARRDTVLIYFVDDNGDVHFSINGEEKGIFFSGVNVSTPLWALLDVYGNTVAMELVDSRQHLNNTRRQQSTPDIDSIIPAFSAITLETSEPELPVRVYRGITFSQLQFHRTKGCNINLSNDRTVAERNDSHYCYGYVFTSRPLRVGERLVIQVTKTEQMYVGALAFGLTSCDPATVNGIDLPEDADSLLDRPEYWVVKKDIGNSPQLGDELTFLITNSGEVQFIKNRQAPTTVMHVDHTLNLWAFLDLYGNTTRVRLLGTTTEIPAVQGSLTRRSLGSIPLSTSVDSGMSGGFNEIDKSPTGSLTVRLPMQEGSSTSGGEIILHPGDNSGNECAICYERQTDSVLYTCGHMCMCFECAVQQWKGQGDGQCPICRAPIRDVIRIYKS